MLRVLVIDDDAPLAGLVAKLLIGPYCLVDQCHTLQAARARTAMDFYDVVLIDGGLGEDPGPELARELMARYPERTWRLVGFTAHAKYASQFEALKLPVLRKPFSLTSLRRAAFGELEVQDG